MLPIHCSEHRNRSRVNKTRASWAMFIATTASFLFATVDAASKIALFAIPIRVYLFNDFTVPTDVQYDLGDQAQLKTAIVSQCTSDLLVCVMSFHLMYSLTFSIFKPMLSDIVVIWRAWVLFPDKQWVMVAPLLLLLAFISNFGPL